MPGKPYQSCLLPYEKEIVVLRRKKPPLSFSQISDWLREKHHIEIGKPPHGGPPRTIVDVT